MKLSMIISISFIAALLSISSCMLEPAPKDYIDDLIAQLTLEEKVRIISGNGMDTLPVYRLGIPPLRMTDGPVGVRINQGTCYPAGIALAASWDAELLNEVGRALGRETKEKGRSMLLGPCINIQRHPLAGRNFESFGEDPYLAGRLAVSYVRGVQAEGIIATPKHFACNNQEWERGSINVIVDERSLREMYLPAFEAAVMEGGAWSVMAAYNKVNGFHATENSVLLNSILKKEWGFSGFVVSDWGAVHSTIPAANYGLDVEMPDRKFFSGKLVAAVKSGDVKKQVIDDKVRRVLRAMDWAGLLGKKIAIHDDTVNTTNTPENRALALRAAQEGMVLLKNENNLLPFDQAKIKTIAVIGPNAARARTGGGGSSEVIPAYAASITDGLQNRLSGKVKIIYAPGCVLPNEPEIIPATALSTGTGEQGLIGEYFNNIRLDGDPVMRRTDSEIRFDWKEDSPGSGIGRDNFSVRWTGKLKAVTGGEIELTIANDDGFRLWLDNKPVIDDWKEHAVEFRKIPVMLEAGREYDIKIEYFERSGYAFVLLGWENPKALIENALDAASKADAVVFCGGLSGMYESEGFDRADMELPGNQNDLILRIAAVNKNICVVMNTGAPVNMSPWIDQVPAILQAWYFGQEGGNAAADVLAGNYNPSGKLPITFPITLEESPAFPNYPGKKGDVTYAEGIYVGYRYFDTKNIQVLFPFGHGLSYTSFQYGNLRLEQKTNRGKHPDVDVSIDITNTGIREGTEIVQLYVCDREASVDRPEKELKEFGRITLKPGQTKTLRFTLGERAFSFYDVNKKKWNAEPGEYEVLAGSSSGDIRLKGVFDYQP